MNKEGTVGQRLAKIRKELRLKQDEVADKAGLKRSSLSKIENDLQEAPLDLLMFYNRTFNVSAEWLLNEEGDPFKEKAQPALQATPSTTPAAANQRTEIVLVTPEQGDLVTVPMVNQKAAANYVTGHNSQAYYEHLDATMMPRYMAKGGTHVWLQVEGDSMETTLYDGDWLLCEQLSRDNWTNIRDYEICVVVTNRRGVQVKRIKNRLKEGFIRCRSDNRKHKPYSVDYEDILELWRVKYNLTNYMPNRSEELYNKVDYLEEQQEDLRALVESLMAQLKKGN